ncbi:MAG: phosphoribosylaminoimidazolesuccinocarboxamide synthase [Pleurocapsa sp. SU_196_0]|nr:phosphoribosylaminoimidazolesuccinocarboxamide synthase [Pleurocapsa sp. SU_196_0]
MTHEELLAAVPHALSSIDLFRAVGVQTSGKVREMVSRGDGSRILVTTDRVSAFDVILGSIPFKGQVLNQLSAWWFEQTKDIVQNHVLSVPDENVTIAREAKPLPVEIVVRGFITGVTKTSLWTMYESGARDAYGVTLPDGLKKNDALPTPVITPTTKAEQGGHDEPITAADIVARGLVGAERWAQVERAALEVFARGQAVARKAGLLLVDTKYEFGTIDSELVLIDEVHTPDSSRYWVLDSYERDSSDPESFDKEFLRLWFAARGYKGEGVPPTMPAEFVAQVAARYIAAYERLTGLEFKPGATPAEERILGRLR